MNLWEDLHQKIHGEPKEPSLPSPPTWPTEERILERSPLSDLFDQSLVDRVADRDNDLLIDEEPFGEENRKSALAALENSGFEAIAFYTPIHFGGDENWGIYFNEPVFFGVCSQVSAWLPSRSWDEVRSCLLEAVYRHECFHAAVELYALVLEDLANIGWWQQHTAGTASHDPSQAASANLPGIVCAYRTYFESEYSIKWPGDDCLEESLANAFEMNRIYPVRGFERVIKELSEFSPPAYRNWWRFGTSETLNLGVEELVSRIRTAASPASTLASKVKGTYHSGWFPELSVPWLESKGPIPTRVYSPGGVRPLRFRSVLGNKKMDDFVNGLKREYGATVEAGGNHPKLIFSNRRSVAYPRKREVPPYLVREVAQAIGVDRKVLLRKTLGIYL